MASPSHRSTNSIDSNSLHAPYATPKQQRRMTSPSLSLPPAGAQQQAVRPPSPLRNGFIPDTFTGINLDEDDDDDDDPQDRHWEMRSPSPSSSVSQFAASFAQRVGSLVSNIAPRSPGSMPTDAELEAEAERERDRSRREAERIITREAMDRRLVEDRVLEMLESTKSLPPPPSRSQTMPNPPSPSSSQKEASGWWAAAKSKLTPTKDKDLTPAQQIIQEAKAREKDKEKEKKNGKGKEKEKEWPANSQNKYADPAFLKLNTPPAPIQRRPVPSSPSSPTPLSHMPPNLSPSPMRQSDSTSSPSTKEPLPVYAQFDAHGTLDVHVTLLNIAKRFEKLEKWTVGHVRALEERMGDVERWLVEKENQKDKESSIQHEEPHAEISELRDEVSELQSRMGELGREMARMAVAPANLSSGPSRKSAEVSTAPQTTSTIVEHENPPSSPPPPPLAVAPAATPSKERFVPSTARQSTSPPMASSSKLASSTRLPYPSGDYATPPDSSILSQGPTYRPSSPSDSLNAISRTQPLSIPGLPATSAGIVGLGISSASSSYSNASFSSASSMSPSGLPRTASPAPASPARDTSKSSSLARPLPSSPGSLSTSPGMAMRMSSVSPTPTSRARKRYTVALGGPIVAPDEVARMDEHGDEFEDETIGKKASVAMSARALAGDYVSSQTPPTSPPDRRIRAQSTYGYSSPLQTPLELTAATLASTPTPVRPLNPQRLRARSTDRLFTQASKDREREAGAGGNKFVDPLVLRRQQEVSRGVSGGGNGGNANSSAGSGVGASLLSKGKGKVPIEELVKFFDGDRKGRS